MVPGIPTQGIPLSERSLAPLNEPSPPITTIPSISLSSIPDYVSGVHFRSDLSNIAPVEFIDQDSVLFKSL